MASFVLNPPPGVHVVSFFVTARFAGQSDRSAFLEAVLSQLSEILGEDPPAAALSDELIAWREDLHAWADRYREAGWPENTPEYLLRGYMRMLRDTDDLPRMRALATDFGRLDRMLDLSGGDVAALADIATIHEYILDQPDPDLPAAWATLGNPNRAEALARSLTHQTKRVEALSALASALAVAGEVDRARETATAAEATAHIINTYEQARVLSELLRENKLIAPRRTAAQALAQTSVIPLLGLVALIDPQAVIENAVHVAPDLLHG
jgi:hypothetical protein